ncbi:uncharacterized protein B0T15DRAFT_43424 [Chaetomium strumarium]|uniref:Luciferase domain-containing protein n=1 Tax=Chaetomium strumarium TaxID=1170767 RepID=A0AAJ0H334_9PEZI|nr:hypothetical protein B0T15DRAFT_43424 [Chaetomium strumarium]
MSSIIHSLTETLNRFLPSRNIPPLSQPLTIALLLAPPTIFALLPSMLHSYRTYLSLGPGGVPYNFFGFLMQYPLSLLAFGASDRRAVPPPYKRSAPREEDVVQLYGRASFFGGDVGDGDGGGGSLLPQRRGDRPSVPGFPIVAPQRQTSMQASGEMVERMRRFVAALAGANAGVLRGGPSKLEGVGSEAIFLGEEVVKKVPEYMGMAKREIVHVHGEGSSHVTVSLVDAEEAVAKGWAERHPLSGVPKMMPWSYIMVYAPRDDDEYEVWKRFVVAGCRFVSGGKEIAVPQDE